MDGQHFAILQRIPEVFSDSEPPIEVVSLLARQLHAGADEIESALEHLPWFDVPRNVLEDQAKSILALSPEGFVHYLPAFLRAALLDPAGESATFTMYALVPLANFDQYFEGTCALFTPDQASVISEFLETVAMHPSFESLRHELPGAITLWKKRAAS